ncbi:MAG TPA: hypothetical protein VFK68_08480 [Propionibacteriaceae bacterium]|nr:hypothetical protein [Propionibacteriaceae bacterium]
MSATDHLVGDAVPAVADGAPTHSVDLPLGCQTPPSIHGVGIDVNSVSRVAGLMDVYGASFVATRFDEVELGEPPYDACKVAEAISAKEAVWKSLRIDERTPVPWRQIVITRCHDAVAAQLDGELQGVATSLGVGPITLSSTVSGDLAFAVAIAETLGSPSSVPNPATS